MSRLGVKNGEHKYDITLKCSSCLSPVTRTRSNMRKRTFCSHNCYWKWLTTQSNWNKGIPVPGPVKKKISETQKRKGIVPPSQKGKVPWNYGIGLLSSIMQLVRASRKCKDWRKIVLNRDNWTCRWCGTKKRLEVHHIKELWVMLAQNRISTIEEAYACSELWDTNNGLTLCKECHDTTRGRWSRKMKQKYLENAK